MSRRSAVRWSSRRAFFDREVFAGAFLFLPVVGGDGSSARLDELKYSEENLAHKLYRKEHLIATQRQSFAF